MNINLLGISGKKGSGKDTVAKIIQYLTTDSMSSSGTFEEYLNFFGNIPMNAADRRYRSSWETKQFARKLKQIVALLINCDIEDLENEKFKSRPLGEEWRRYYWYHYKFANNENLNGKVGAYHTNKDDAHKELDKLNYQVWNKLLAEAELRSEVLTPRLLLQEIGTEGLRGIHPEIHVLGTFAEYTEKEEYVGGSGSTSYPTFYYPKWILTDCRFKNEAKAIKERNGIIIRVERPDIISNDNHLSETELDNHRFDYTIINDRTIEQLVESVKLVLKDCKII